MKVPLPALPRPCRSRIRSSVLSPWIVYPVKVLKNGNGSAWLRVNAARLSSHTACVALGSNSVGHRLHIMNLRSWGTMMPVLVSSTPLAQFSRCESRSKSHRKQVIRGSDSAEIIVLETRSAFSDWLAHFRKVRFRVSYSAMASLSTSSSPVAAAGFMVSASRRMSAAIAFRSGLVGPLQKGALPCLIFGDGFLVHIFIAGGGGRFHGIRFPANVRRNCLRQLPDLLDDILAPAHAVPHVESLVVNAIANVVFVLVHEPPPVSGSGPVVAFAEIGLFDAQQFENVVHGWLRNIFCELWVAVKMRVRSFGMCLVDRLHVGLSFVAVVVVADRIAVCQVDEYRSEEHTS